MNRNPLQQISISKILNSAFAYWSKAMLYHFIYSILYLSLFFVGYYSLFQYFGLWDEIMQHRDLVRTDLPAFNKKVEEIARLPQAQNFGLAFFLLLALINPLNVGLFKIYRKIDLKEPIGFNDLLAGYQGFDFFKFFGFYLFWLIIFTYANALLFLGIFWIFITLFSVPLMFFMNVKTFEGISLTLKGLRGNFATIVICMIVAAAFSFCGILLCGFGFLLTFPFWQTMIYTLYQNLYKEIG